MKNIILMVFIQTVLCIAVIGEAQAAPKSEALQIARAAGLKQLKDVPRDKIDQAIRERPDMTTSNVITTVGIGTEVFSQQTGWSLGAETAALGVLTILSSLPVHQPERHTRLLVWMPRDLAETPEAAAALLKKMVISAYRAALPDINIEMDTRDSKGFPDNPLKYLRVDEPECDRCGVSMYAVLHYEAKPKKRKAPKILGRYKSYNWSVDGFRNAFLAGYPMGAKHLSRDEKMNIYTRVSQNLPEWVYLYVAPSEELADFPILLNQGEPMLFIEPISE